MSTIAIVICGAVIALPFLFLGPVMWIADAWSDRCRRRTERAPETFASILGGRRPPRIP